MAHESGRRSHKHNHKGAEGHDSHIRHPEDNMSETHLANAVGHLKEHVAHVHHMVKQHHVEGGFDGEHNVPGAGAGHERYKSDRTGD